MNVAVKTDVGLIREINQDAYLWCSEPNIALFAVADGMGGHNAGEIASSLAINTINDIIYRDKNKLENGDSNIFRLIYNILNKANNVILSKSEKENDLSGMGTTITLAYIYDDNIYIGHIGDSRAYLFRNNKLIQITEDHSLVAQLVKNGTISEEEAANHPQKNIITRALGTDYIIKPDIFKRDIENGDIIMLCTDGLTNMLKDEDISEILTKEENLDVACDTLINKANNVGGTDNTTVMLIKVD
ncbi:Stp1/IreP family PP2C-type Ser/Thr phosphatase [Clostridiisalibacter paucivorans]|uniref:Stp1/IreP family PP2C-type Ser/Thr phosphatase n=1 Tax=Clostridiisalibacter paucivorans TaxID=408753 RepID=UPI00047C2E5C|nr:Stp1/IreP family PP2C-type Ser/Thr phosphatase [Clostridiisalibacter paucivorans]